MRTAKRTSKLWVNRIRSRIAISSTLCRNHPGSRYSLRLRPRFGTSEKSCSPQAGQRSRQQPQGRHTNRKATAERISNGEAYERLLP
jgi:hypothetical protein